VRTAVGDRLAAEETPRTLIRQREAKRSKLHGELVALRSNRDLAVRRVLVGTGDRLDGKVERGLRDARRSRRDLLEPSFPVERLEPEEAIVRAVRERHQRGGREIPIHEDDEPSSRFGKKAHVHGEAVDGSVVHHQRVASVRFANPPERVMAISYFGFVHRRHVRL